MKDERLPKMVIFGQPSRAKRKEGHCRIGWKEVSRKGFKEIVTSWEFVKRGA